MSILSFELPAELARERIAPAGDAFTQPGWRVYLVLAALLTPLVVPSGPAQFALLDGLNLLLLGAFFVVAVGRRVPIVLPFVVPVLVMGVGSLLAITNALSVQASALNLAQDAYLYLWLVALLAVMSRSGDLFGFRLAWVLAANLAALVCIFQAATNGAFPGLLLSAKGFRPAGTFYGANMCADYLVLSVFVALSLWGRTSRLFLLASIALLLVGLLTTKSNGSLIALVIGGGATTLLLALQGEASRRRRTGALALLAAVSVLAFWAHDEWGVGAGLSGASQGSMLDRMGKSSEGRKEIWGQLGTQLAKHPLGIGPGNSVLQSVAIGHRVRPGSSFQSKEAHSDYMGYAIERGPIGLLGHLMWILAGIGLVLGGRNGGTDTSRGRLADPGAAARRANLLRAVFVGGLIASAVHSVVIEKLHFRHYWLFLALACASTAGARFRSAADAPESAAAAAAHAGRSR